MDENDNATATLCLSGVDYIEFLHALHTHLTPRSYLEVGTSTGASLAVAGCDTIVVHPGFAIPAGATGNRSRTFFFQMTSDDFFATENAPALLGRPVDMAFLDGMHLFECLLRDFIGAEAACHPRSLILWHACLPSNTRMALRQYQPGDSCEGDTAGWWTGDVWKLLPILREYRPDLRLHVLDCPPTGLVAITGLDPASSVLADRYHEIVDQHAATVLDEDRLRSLWDNLELTASRPLCEEPDRLTDLFRLDCPDQPKGPLPGSGTAQKPAGRASYPPTSQEPRSKTPLRTRPSPDINHPSRVLPPWELQDWVGGGGPGVFKATGNEFLGYLVELCGLQPGDAVLDVGCGSGRMALPLTGYLNREGRYAGFDVSREAIAWCTENISGSHPNFDFTVVDIQNRLYNPTGRYEASDFRFPYPDESFDVVLLASLFTHMLPADVKHYLHEIVRVLKPGGRSLITYFLLNEESSALSKEGKASFDFEHEMQGYRTTHVDHPEAATAYPEAFVRDLYGECGLELREPLRYGTWSGRTNGMSGQDVVIAVKAAGRNRLPQGAHTSDIERPKGSAKYPLIPLSAENIALAEAVSRSMQENTPDLPRFGRSISFGRGGHSEEVIGPGWSLQDDNCRWMIGGSSVLALPMPTESNAADVILLLRVTPFLVNGQIDCQRCTVVCGSETVADVKLRTSGWIGFRISAEAVASEKLAILFVHPDAGSPQKFGIVPDSRELAIAVLEAVLLPAMEDDELMGWRGGTGHFVSSDWRAQALVPDWKKIAYNFQSMGQSCELGLLQRECAAEPLGLFRFANSPLHGLIQCLRSEFSELTNEQELNIAPDPSSASEYVGEFKTLDLWYHTHVLVDQDVDVDALRCRESTRLKMLVRFFREDLEDGERVFVLERKFAPLEEFEVLPVISLMRRYNPKATLLWITVAGPDERHLVGQCEMVGNNLLKGYLDRFIDWEVGLSTLSVECWKDILVSALQALGRPIPTQESRELERLPGDPASALNHPTPPVSRSMQENTPDLPRFGRSISFGRGGHSEEVIGPGWSLQDDNCRWMIGGSSVLALPMPTESNAADVILMLRVTPFLVNGQIDCQRCTVVCGSETVADVKLRTSGWIGFRISAEAVASEKLAILFVHPDAGSPQKFGIVPDSRELAIAVLEAVLLPAMEDDELMGWRGDTGHFVSSDWRAQALVPDWKKIAYNFQSMGQDCEFGLLQRECTAEPLGLFRFANSPLHGLIQCLRSEFSELTNEEKLEISPLHNGEYWSEFKTLELFYHTHVLVDQDVDVDALRRKESTRLKMLVRLFREDLEDGEKVFVLLRKFAPLEEFEVLPVISLMRRYNPKATLLWITVAGPDERHLVGQCEMVGNNLLKGYIDRFSGQNDDWSTLSVECWKDILVSAMQALGRPIPTHA